MKVTQHIPAYIEDETPAAEAEVSTVDELLLLPWVSKWTDTTGFGSWMYIRHTADVWALMAVLTDRSFWVVAYVSSNDDPALPLWPTGRLQEPTSS